MRIDRRTTTVGLAALALVGLTSGGIAWAATDAPGPSSAGAFGHHCAGGQHLFGDDSMMTAAADYLGLPPEELVDRLRSGQSLADVARAEGKTVAGLKDAMVTVMERRLAENSDLTPAQRTAMLTLMKSHLDAMISGDRAGMGWDHMDWDDMGGMMGGHGPGPGPGMMGGRGGGWGGPGGGMMG